MRKGSKIALVAGAFVVAASAMSYQLFGHMLEPDPVLAQLPIGTTAPNFRGNDVNGRLINLADHRGKTVVLEWNNPECPTVKEHYDSGTMQKTQAAAAADGVVWLTINSSAKGKQGYMTTATAQSFAAGQQSHRTAYLRDPQGVVGKAYGAMATPHMFVINKAGKLVYRGAVIDSAAASIGGGAGEGNLVLAALNEMKAGKPVSVPTSRAYGCGVKYKA
jgi:peroxiredoxin